MKKYRIVTVVCWAITALAITGLAVWFMTGTLFGIGTNGWFSGLSFNFGWESLSGHYEVVGEYSVPVEGISSLDIDWSAGHVTVKPHDDSEIKIIEEAQRGLRDDEFLQYSASGSTLTIKYSGTNAIRQSISSKRLKVLLPRSLSESFDRLTVNTSSAGIDVSDINALHFKADTSSGAMQLSNIKAQDYKAETTSGSLTLIGAHADDMNLKSISGTIQVTDGTAGTLYCDTTSGLQHLSGEFDKAHLGSISGRISLMSSAPLPQIWANTTSGGIEVLGRLDTAELGSVSGDVSVRSAIVPSSLSVNTTSGGITIAVPNEGAVSVSHSSVSGKLSSDIPFITQSSAAQFRISTVSGGTRITAYE